MDLRKIALGVLLPPGIVAAVGFLLQAMADQGIGFFDWWFYFEVLTAGLLLGVQYALVALGFVLIFKASGVFNFAQGSMVFFAALTLVGLLESDVPLLLAVPITLLVMWALAAAIERLVLRRLVNQEPIILFMATIGIFYVLESGGQLVWGSQVHELNIGLPTGRFDIALLGGAIQVQVFDLVTALIAGVLVAALAIFFNRTRIGRALRAVADDHQAALSVGIPLKQIWVIVWTVAGVVALVAGITWGKSLGVQPALTLIALKALPVLILGGFTSIPGAIVGGLIIGAGEQVGEVFFGSLVGGAVQDWFAYMLAMVFLLFRPQGLFGERIIERV
jgi:branched-chain amino acid transport system permease protein